MSVFSLHNVFWLSCHNAFVFSLTRTQVSKPVLDNVLNCLKIEVSDITITLSARWATSQSKPFVCLFTDWQTHFPLLDFSLKPFQDIRCNFLCVYFFSSVGEREDWFHTLSRAIADHAAGLCTFGGPCSEVRKTLLMLHPVTTISLSVV